MLAPLDVHFDVLTVMLPPSDTDVPLIVIAEFASAELAIAVKPDPIAPEVSVPTEVSEELTTPLPSVVAERTSIAVPAPLRILYVSPNATRTPELNVTLLENV